MDKRIAVSANPLFFGVLAWLLLYEKQGLAAGCLAASLIHECGHLTAMFVCKALPRRIHIGIFGMRIERDAALSVSFWQDAFIAAGGPLINLLCCGGFLLCGKVTAAALHFLTAALNLLPVEALDGGQLLLSLLYRRLPRERAEKCVFICSLLTVFPLGIAGFFVLLRSGCNASLLLVDAYLILLLIFKRKR